MKDGWTSHGHPVPGVAVYGTRPERVMRCGGPALCKVCKREAGEARGPQVGPHAEVLRQTVMAAMADPRRYAGPAAAFLSVEADREWRATAVLNALRDLSQNLAATDDQ